MKFAATVCSYELTDMVELNVRALRHVFGPDLPILVSDDLNRNSAEIRDLAARLDVHHFCSETRRGHFAGDCNSSCAAISFGESQGADLCLKLSQRLILFDPVMREVLERYFADPNVWLGLPGRISPATIKRAESRFFANLSVLTDFLCVRSGKLSPKSVKDLYEERVNSRRSHHDGLIEALWAYITDTLMCGHTVFINELTNPRPGWPPLFLRKAQFEPADYQRAASELGMTWNGVPLLQEWRALDPNYRPVPSFL